jgi:hypothetical protein
MVKRLAATGVPSENEVWVWQVLQWVPHIHGISILKFNQLKIENVWKKFISALNMQLLAWIFPKQYSIACIATIYKALGSIYNLEVT